jgi:hypothetical protein
VKSSRSVTFRAIFSGWWNLGSTLGLALGDIAGKELTAVIWLGRRPLMTALFFARIDPRKNVHFYCNAGRPAPLLLRNKKTLERLEEGGSMLGTT